VETRLLAIRHGATEWNHTGRFQGRSDVPLSDEGRAQARALAAALRREPLRRVIASDLSRAYETARIVAEPHGLPVETDARLREFDFGAWEGLRWDEIVERFPELQDRARTEAVLYAPSGGERFDDVVERVRAFVRDFPREAGSITVVTHAGVLHALFAVLGLHAPDGRPLRFSPGSLTTIALGERSSGEPARLILFDHVPARDSTDLA